MTPAELEQIIENNVTVPFLTALKAYGIGETAGRRAAKKNALPFRVVKSGNRMRVPTSDLTVLLRSDHPPVARRRQEGVL